MYYLTQKVRPTAGSPEVYETIGRALRLLSDASADLVFEPERHIYTLAGRELRSVSSIVESYSTFDEVATAKTCVANPKSKYYGMNVEDVLKGWEENAKTAADAGTLVHEFAEVCYLWSKNREDEIDPRFRDRITAQGLAAESPKEIAVAKWWDNLDWNRYIPVAKENRIVNPVLRYAGTFDLLLYDTFTGTFVIRDWKTNKDLYSWYGDWMKGGFHKILKDNDEGHYTLQQILYAIEIQNLGIPVSEAKLVWLKEDSEYEEYEINMKMQNLILNVITRDLNKS